MATTAHTAISAGTVISGTPMIKWSNLASTYTPADWVYFTALTTATHLDSDTAICNFGKPFELEFKPRVSTVMARKDSDDTYLAADSVPVILGSKVPAFITTVAKITNPGKTVYSGHAWMASATAGDIGLMADWGSSAAAYFNRIRFIVNGFNTDTLVTGDTYMKMTWM